MPLTSPIAHRRSPARRCSSTCDPAGVGLDADRLQADPLDARAPAGGHQQPVAAQLRTAVEAQDILVTFPPRGGGVRPEHQLDPVPAQGLGERLAERRRLAGKHPVGALDEHHLAAETPHDLRKLDARRPATQHQQAARDGLHARRLAGAPHALELAESSDRRHDRIGAGRHDDVLRRVADAVDFDHAGPGQPARAAQQVDAPARQPALLAGVGVVGDHEVAPSQRGLNVDLGASHRRRARPAPPRPGAAATSTECKPSTSTRRRPALAQRRRRAARAQPAPQRNARRARRRRERSRRSHWSSSSLPPSVAGDITAAVGPRAAARYPSATQSAIREAYSSARSSHTKCPVSTHE